MTSYNCSVGQYIKKRLSKINKTEEDFAKELNTSGKTVKKIINGRKNLSLTELKRIADLFEIDLDDLIKSTLEEEDVIASFIEEVGTDAAKAGLEKARKVMDMIFFHRDINESYKELMKEENDSQDT